MPRRDIWYVSYRSNIMPKRDDGERKFARATRRFRTEAEAKEFAQEIIAKGWLAIAGTINPYKPKKTVSSREILNWIAGKERKSECGGLMEVNSRPASSD